jgi:hypothetical protein
VPFPLPSIRPFQELEDGVSEKWAKLRAESLRLLRRKELKSAEGDSLMKTQRNVRTFLVATAVLAFASFVPAAHAQTVPNIPGVPPISTNTQTPYQQQTHFLTFLGSFIPESAASATAYYNAIDPTASKRTFTKWLVNAGFIANESQWHPSGAQDIRTGQPAGVYGDNIINTDSHVIVVNAADLGFVRNQFIRCKPSCTALNPIIYTYLENYPVAPFAAGGSGFPGATGYPTQAEAAAAINSATNRPWACWAVTA